MKISIYEIKNLYPSTENQYQNYCEIMDTPTLKSGYIEVLGNFNSYINKSELKKLQKVSYKIYDTNKKEFIDGMLILKNHTSKLFAVIN
jgi:hypothetical protein